MQNQSQQLKQLKSDLANLREFLVRFTKVYEGVLPDIDILLAGLRTELSTNGNPAKLTSMLAALTGPVLQNADALKHFNQQFSNRLETFSNQILTLNDTSVEIRQDITQFISDLKSNPISIVDTVDYLERCLSLVFKVIDNLVDGTQSNLQELSTATDLHEKITLEFKELVALLIASEPKDKALQEIQGQFEKGLSRQELLECCLIVLKTLMSDVLSERKHAEKYLIGLQKKLKAFGGNVEKSITDSQERFQVKLEHQVSLRNHMEVIDNVVSNNDDIQELKQQASAALEKMANTLSDREQSEKDEQLGLMDLLAQMKSQLASLEKETEAYKQRLLEQKYHSHRDPLTQIANRNAYNDRVELEYRRWKRHKLPISIAIVDIDHFKKINDNFGHAAGDKTLQVIAQSISKCLRATDFFARWGGEEFVVLLPQTAMDNLIKPLETIRKQIQQIPFKFRDKSVSITASIGATEFVPGDTIQTAFERADKALYQAKHSGRNRCNIIKG